MHKRNGDTGTSIGELNVGLSYIPTLSRLNVVVGKARNLRKVDLQSNGMFCVALGKLFLLCGLFRKLKKKLC